MANASSQPPSPQQQSKLARMQLAQNPQEEEDWEKPSITCILQRGRYLIVTAIAIMLVLGVMLAVNLYYSGEAAQGVKKAVNKAGTRFIDNLMKNTTFWETITSILTRVVLSSRLEEESFSTSAPFSSEG
jgi:hypothetical protein